MSWRVTVRHGSAVTREKLPALDDAIAYARECVDGIRREDRLPPVSMLRDFSPSEQVQARIEISGPGLLRKPEAGIDVMGDGHAIAYSGAIRKQTIEADTLDDAFGRLRDTLSGDG